VGRARLALVLLVAATVAAAIAFLVRGPLASGRSKTPAKGAGEATAPGASGQGAAAAGEPSGRDRAGSRATAASLDPTAARALLAGLAAALESGDPAALDRAARELRARLLGADRATLEALAALLLDDGLPVRLRQALAVVLGSLPGERALALLAAALERCAGPPELVRSLLVAIGEARTGPGAGRFAEGDRANAFADGSGLAPYVAGPIGHDGARRAAVERLEDKDVETRRTAARVLRDSRRAAEVHQALVERLGAEDDDEAAGEVASALGATALETDRDDPARAEALEAMLAAAPKRGRDVARFRMETALGSTALEPDEEREIVRLIDHADPNVQLFALEVIYRRLASGVQDPLTGIPDLEAAVATALAPGRDPKVRETAARALGPVADRKAATTALVQALAADPLPKVRAAAARALGAFAAGGRPLPEPAVAALEAAAAADVDAEAREAARAALERRR